MNNSGKFELFPNLYFLLVPQVTKETFLQAINKSEASSVEVQPVEWLKNDFVTEHKKHWDESSQDEQVY